MTERRLRIYSIQEKTMLDLFRADDPECFVSPILDLPEGYKVLRVFPEPECLCIDFLIEHESFEPVPDCCRVPRHGEIGLRPTVTVSGVLQRLKKEIESFGEPEKTTILKFIESVKNGASE
jgi:hypothetical protein